MADNRLKAVATARAYDQGNIATLDDAMTRRLVASTVLTESYGGDLTPINRLGYVGRYQAGAAWLVDAGYMDLEKYRAARNSMSAREWEIGGGQLRFMRDARNWNDGLSLDRYLASDDLQDRAFRINCNRSYRQAVRNGLLDENASPETVAAFLKARHLSGYEGARNVMQNGRVIRDENGTSNYDYFHDITRNRDGLNDLMSRDVQQRPTPPPPAQPQQPAQIRTVRSFDDVMRTMLPPQGNLAPHMTSDYGHRTLNGRADHHGGVDFNYVGGQNGINLRHPVVRSPVSGVVIYGAGQGSYGTVKIRDDQGNVHEILHLDSRSVRVTDPPTRINAGDAIGTMGGRGPNGAGQYAQHVHYQVRDASGRTVDPEAFWRNRSIEVPGTRTQDPLPRTPAGDRHAAIADGVLRQGERGDDVLGLQKSLNRLGIRDARGNPLVEDGRYGDRTFEAIEAYQRAHGLKVDGIAGPRTLESIGRRLPGGTVSVEPGPMQARTTTSSDPLFTALRERLPAIVSDAQVAGVTDAARRSGVDAPGKLESVTVQDDVVFVRGTTPGFRARVDLSQPLRAPSRTDDTALASTQTVEPPTVRRALGA